MRTRGATALGVALLLAGVGLLAIAASRGEVQVGLLLVVPFLVASGPFAFLGGLLLMAGFLTLFLAASGRAVREAASEAFGPPGMVGPPRPARPQAPPEPRAGEGPRGPHGEDAGAGPRPWGWGWSTSSRRTEGGGFLLLGPIPIAWGSSRGLATTMMLLALAFLAALVVLSVLLAGAR